LVYKSGTSFNYGNQTFKLLGKILEFSTKKSFSESANALFKKCKMTHTFCYEESKKAGIVSGHSNKSNSITVIDENQINTESIPADGIVSNVKDLAIWDVNLHKGKILKPETYKLMTSYSVKAQHDAFGEKPIGYGYGIRINDDDTIKMIGHTGMGSGFTCVNFYFPESETSLIVLENHMNNNIKIGYYFESEIRKIILKSTLLKPTK
jgi:D-alanyl-D-alanine carboxypeptidase